MESLKFVGANFFADRLNFAGTLGRDFVCYLIPTRGFITLSSLFNNSWSTVRFVRDVHEFDEN